MGPNMEQKWLAEFAKNGVENREGDGNGVLVMEALGEMG